MLYLRELEELINKKDSAWSIINRWIKRADKPVDILPVEREKSQKVLFDLQVTTRSPLGAIAYECGGILVDNGWLRILGSGCDIMKRDISSWNELNDRGRFAKIPGAMLIADDIIGGFFALNGGAFKAEIGKMFYLAPESHRWESLDINYSQFIFWALTGDVKAFYGSYRWKGWEQEVKAVSPDKGILFYPFLWTSDFSFDKCIKSVVPIEEMWQLCSDTIENL